MRSAFLYEDKIREMILKFKYYNRTFLSADLSEEMIKVYEKHPFFQQTDFIIAVPSNFFRRFKRGYNQALLLARAVSLKTGKPSLENILFRKKLTKAQFKLSKKQRAKNIDGSFYVKNKKAVEKKNILLIDDIATTAITASTCAKTLKKAGAKKVFVLTLARD
jgi:ComF family protein